MTGPGRRGGRTGLSHLLGPGAPGHRPRAPRRRAGPRRHRGRAGGGERRAGRGPGGRRRPRPRAGRPSRASGPGRPGRPVTPAGASGCTAVAGIVQGVGFRPFVYGLAARLGLAGFVGNDERGVLIEAEGPAPRWTPWSPRCASGRRRWPWSTDVAATALPPAGGTGFAIVGQRGRAGGRARLVSAGHRDLRGLPAPSCATRPTAGTGTRSSTARTAGRGSRSSPACPTTGRRRRWPASRCARRARAEYHDPADRRFHAQPVCCPDCGPTLRLDGWATGPADGGARRPVAAARRRAARRRGAGGQGPRRLPPGRAGRRRTPPSRRCARASTARTSRSR